MKYHEAIKNENLRKVFLIETRQKHRNERRLTSGQANIAGIFPLNIL